MGMRREREPRGLRLFGGCPPTSRRAFVTGLPTGLAAKHIFNVGSPCRSYLTSDFGNVAL